ncbi:MAG: symmetrical bis(5'-nucleosyl)-tetraphosphatase [Gammaproteobacteria bacterium]|nr:symmetrical bis(5'-nucleosyl)-tetraphosphatase [Gammaproteobacteria bacterium]
MADWAIGDVQGCYKELRKLCKKIDFNPSNDRLWLVGDLVNRGPKSLDVLRFVSDLGDSAEVILGNHDLHLLAIRAGVTEPRGGDTLNKLLKARDSDELLDWLQRQPLVKAHEDGHHVMLHAGVVPQWSVSDAVNFGEEVHTVLCSKKATKFFNKMYGNEPAIWDPALSGAKRWRFITNTLTRVRYCGNDGELQLKHKGPPDMASTDTIKPWYEWRPADQQECIVTGHWSALGIRQTDQHVSIDTGCVWGGELTAYNLEDKSFIQVASKQPKASFMKPSKKFKPKKGPRWRAFLRSDL